MLIALDIGNSSTNLGRIVDGEVVLPRRAQTSPRATADELALLLDGLLALDGGGLADVREIVAASVVPALGATLAELCRQAGQTEIDMFAEISRRVFAAAGRDIK